MINILREDHDQTDEPGLGPSTERRTSKLDSEEQRAELVEGFRRGMSINALASKYGVSATGVKRLLRRYGVGRRQRY